MSQIYQMKSSFDDGKTWYQLEWLDVEFRDFESVGLKCDSIEELVEEIGKAFPDSKLKYEYIGERKKKTQAPKETTKKQRKKR